VVYGPCGYNPTMKAVAILILIACTASAVGCGQKGPLVLPDAEHPRKKVKFPAPPKSGAPASTPAAPDPAPPEAAPQS
jgi:predicted small lipoprotein YifL